MNMNTMKKALIKGIPMGLGATAFYGVIRYLMHGGTVGDHLFSLLGILTMISFTIGWVYIFFKKEKEKAQDKA